MAVLDCTSRKKRKTLKYGNTVLLEIIEVWFVRTGNYFEFDIHNFHNFGLLGSSLRVDNKLDVMLKILTASLRKINRSSDHITL